MDKMLKKQEVIVKGIDKTKADIEALLNDIKAREEEYANKVKQLEESTDAKQRKCQAYDEFEYVGLVSNVTLDCIDNLDIK